MSKFNKVTPEFVEKLRSILGEKGVTTDPEKLLTFQTDEEGNSTGSAPRKWLLSRKPRNK